jgi:hypothetical protein
MRFGLDVCANNQMITMRRIIARLFLFPDLLSVDGQAADECSPINFQLKLAKATRPHSFIRC